MTQDPPGTGDATVHPWPRPVHTTLGGWSPPDDVDDEPPAQEPLGEVGGAAATAGSGALTTLAWSAATAAEPRAQLVPVDAGAPATTPAPGAEDHAAVPAPEADDDGVTPRTEALSHQTLVRPRGERPTTGWRGAAFTATGGRWNPGLSPVEALRLDLRRRIRAQLGAPHEIVVASLKGGVGKTTVTSLLGKILAEHRGDQVIALDANPDAGTLADRVLGRAAVVTVRDLLTDLAAVEDSTDVAGYTGLSGRLHVLASEHDPVMSAAFNQQEYEAVLGCLRRFYNVLLTDSGTGLTHSAIQGALAAAKTLVVVGAPTVDGASRASKTLDWLTAHGYGDLAANAVVALSGDRSSPDVDPDAVYRHFASRSRAVVPIPADPHLATGGLIELDQLRPQTYDAALTLAAEVADQFEWPGPQRRRGLRVED